MLAMLMMLPLPRAAIVGASAPTRKYGARTLAANSRSKVATSSSAVGPNQENPALLTSTLTRPAWSTRSSSWSGSLRSAATNRALPPSAVIAVDHRRAAGGVPAVHDHLGALPAERFGRCPADARTGPGNQRTDALKVTLLIHLLSFHD